nr:hypothetical protein [Tanacetum cinerariifolium]
MVVGESSQTLVKNTTLTFQCLILTSTNYTTWSMRMEVLLGIHRVWEVVDSGLADAKKNDFVKEVGRVKEARLQTLITKFENLKMLDNGTIDEYTAKLSGIASKSATLGEVMSKHKLVVDEQVNPHSSSVHETILESEEDESGSDDTSIPIARFETI